MKPSKCIPGKYYLVRIYTVDFPALCYEEKGEMFWDLMLVGVVPAQFKDEHSNIIKLKEISKDIAEQMIMEESI